MNTFQIVFKSTALIFLYCILLKIAVLYDNVLQLYHTFPEKSLGWTRQPFPFQ